MENSQVPILGKLLEKKDVLDYIKPRITILEEELDIVLTSVSDQDKRSVRKQFDERILELKELEKTIEQCTLKLKSVSYSREDKTMTLVAKLQEVKTTICDNCHGKGWHDYDGDKLDDEGSEKCAKCNGTGRINIDDKTE